VLHLRSFDFSCEVPKHTNCPLDRLRCAEEDGDTGAGQRLYVFPAVLLLYGDDEVWLEFEDSRHIYLLRPADLRDSTDHARRLGAVAGTAHDPLTGAEGEERLHQARDEADGGAAGPTSRPPRR
jgi:hypothetical protein